MDGELANTEDRRSVAAAEQGASPARSPTRRCRSWLGIPLIVISQARFSAGVEKQWELTRVWVKRCCGVGRAYLVGEEDGYATLLEGWTHDPGRCSD